MLLLSELVCLFREKGIRIWLLLVLFSDISASLLSFRVRGGENLVNRVAMVEGSCSLRDSCL